MELSKNNPIGIFDSGIGGLTVAKAINDLMPNEKIIYFGDTLHLPYGDKSPNAIKEYSRGIAHFLSIKNCKMIVIACNSASSHGTQIVKRVAGKNGLVCNVIEPTIEHVIDSKSKNVGVIGTKATISSNIYEKGIKEIDNQIDVKSLATPLLAPMIEEGFFSDQISQTIIQNYLNSSELDHIEALILGCTHYPLIKKDIEKLYLNKNIDVIDSSVYTAKKVKNMLEEVNLLASRKVKPSHHFYVSDYTKSFEKSATYFFKNKVHLKLLNIWA